MRSVAVKSRILAISLAIAAILAAPGTIPAVSAQAVAEPPDLEATPDLGGLLAAVRGLKAREVLPGLWTGEARDEAFGVLIHLFEFDPARFSVRIVEQKAPTGSRASEFLSRETDVFAINGGFFERDDNKNLSPSGLLVTGGAAVAAEHDRAGSGIFYSDETGIGIASRRTFRPREGLREALQVGPLLVDPGGVKGIYKDDIDRHNRSAICLRNGHLAFIAVEGGLSLFQLADILSLPAEEGGFGCEIALNLDGGPSTQATLGAGSARIEIAGGTPVQNAIVVSRRP